MDAIGFSTVSPEKNRHSATAPQRHSGGLVERSPETKILHHLPPAVVDQQEEPGDADAPNLGPKGRLSDGTVWWSHVWLQDALFLVFRKKQRERDRCFYWKPTIMLLPTGCDVLAAIMLGGGHGKCKLVVLRTCFPSQKHRCLEPPPRPYILWCGQPNVVRYQKGGEAEKMQVTNCWPPFPFPLSQRAWCIPDGSPEYSLTGPCLGGSELTCFTHIIPSFLLPYSF